MLNFLTSFFVIFFIDQLSKMLAEFKGIVSYNSGISFGIPWFDNPFIGFLITLFILAGLFFLFKDILKKHPWLWGSLCGAAISNAVDRVISLGVKDYLSIPFLELKNNIADWVIFFCLLMLIWYVLKDEKKSNEPYL